MATQTLFRGKKGRGLVSQQRVLDVKRALTVAGGTTVFLQLEKTWHVRSVAGRLAGCDHPFNKMRTLHGFLPMLKIHRE